MDKSLIVRCQARGLAVTVELNGLLLGVVQPGQDTAWPVHEFIFKGVNTLKVCHWQATEADRSKPCGVRLQIALQKNRGAHQLVQAQPISEFAHEVGEFELLSGQCLLDCPVELPVSFPRWRFLDIAPPMRTQEDLAPIHNFMARLLGYCRRRELDQLLPFYRLRNQELCAAYGLDVSQAHQEFRQRWRFCLDHGVLSAGACNPQAWQIRPSAHQGLYSLHQANLAPWLAFDFEAPVHTVAWPMHVAVVQGDVFVVR